jgi:hypothetical protein
MEGHGDHKKAKKHPREVDDDIEADGDGATRLTAATKKFFVAQNLPDHMKSHKLSESNAKAALNGMWQQLERGTQLSWEARRRDGQKSRDNFPDAVRHAIRDESGSFCARCGEETVLRDGDSVINFGEAAHIIPASADGPRGKNKPEGWTNDDTKSFRNGLWLCPPCHKLIDCEQFALKFPVHVLKEFKAKARQAAVERATTQHENFRGLDWSEFAAVGAAVVRSRPDTPAPTFVVAGGHLAPGEKPGLGAGFLIGSGHFDVRAPPKK